MLGGRSVNAGLHSCYTYVITILAASDLPLPRNSKGATVLSAGLEGTNILRKTRQSKEEVPFDGVLGDTSELRILEQLIRAPLRDFNITELGRASGLSRPVVDKVVKRFAKQGVVTTLPRRGNMTFYKLNESSDIVETILELSTTLGGRGVHGSAILDDPADAVRKERRIQSPVITR